MAFLYLYSTIFVFLCRWTKRRAVFYLWNVILSLEERQYGSSARTKKEIILFTSNIVRKELEGFFWTFTNINKVFPSPPVSKTNKIHFTLA